MDYYRDNGLDFFADYDSLVTFMWQEVREANGDPLDFLILRHIFENDQI